MGFYAIRLPRGTPASGSNILVVDGQFTDIDQGNKLRRIAIGLGMGQSKLDANAQVYQVVNGTAPRSWTSRPTRTVDRCRALQ